MSYVELDMLGPYMEYKNKHSKKLTLKEFQIAYLLMGNDLSKSDIANHLNWRTASKSIDVHICSLRKKIANLNIKVEFDSGKYAIRR